VDGRSQVRRRRALRLVACAALLGLIFLVVAKRDLLAWVSLSRLAGSRLMTEQEYERWARQQFEAKYPGQKPLNWRIANTAKRFHAEKPMGKFVLHKNDCSDFVDCILDDALGPKARFRRNSDQHVVANTPGLMRSFYWTQGDPALPGDILTVIHSPWYPPHEPPDIAHIGVVGPEGTVYDFTKLRSWRSARYGEHEFTWFVRHCAEPQEVIITRLRPEFRYRVRPLPW
jgi:hypothetical protein